MGTTGRAPEVPAQPSPYWGFFTCLGRPFPLPNWPGIIGKEQIRNVSSLNSVSAFPLAHPKLYWEVSGQLKLSSKNPKQKGEIIFWKTFLFILISRKNKNKTKKTASCYVLIRSHCSLIRAFKGFGNVLFWEAVIMLKKTTKSALIISKNLACNAF